MSDTDMPDNDQRPAADPMQQALTQQALLQHFADAAASVLSQISGATLQAESAAAREATAIQASAHEAAATLLRIEISGALQGVCEIALTAAMSAHFAALLTGETPDLSAAEISSDTREAAAELIQQICGNAADRLRRAFGPLELKPHLADPDPDSGAHQLVQITGSDRTLEFELHILRLVAQSKPAEAKPTAQPEAAPQPAPPSTPPAAASPAANRNLDLLLDIELGVTLRFGTRRMLLKDIIELCSGSVVELDRRVEEPVELLIDGRLIALGEVVIVEGNYGLRVTQVAAPGERIACLP
jgi:flagellar motor switch protein FliN/FliY